MQGLVPNLLILRAKAHNRDVAQPGHVKSRRDVEGRVRGNVYYAARLSRGNELRRVICTGRLEDTLRPCSARCKKTE